MQSELLYKPPGRTQVITWSIDSDGARPVLAVNMILFIFNIILSLKLFASRSIRLKAFTNVFRDSDSQQMMAFYIFQENVCV